MYKKRRSNALPRVSKRGFTANHSSVTVPPIPVKMTGITAMLIHNINSKTVQK